MLYCYSWTEKQRQKIIVHIVRVVTEGGKYDQKFFKLFNNRVSMNHFAIDKFGRLINLEALTDKFYSDKIQTQNDSLFF